VETRAIRPPQVRPGLKFRRRALPLELGPVDCAAAERLLARLMAAAILADLNSANSAKVPGSISITPGTPAAVARP